MKLTVTGGLIELPPISVTIMSMSQTLLQPLHGIETTEWAATVNEVTEVHVTELQGLGLTPL